jgi:ABC transporter substrate binding protein (PQQ-dependent alcohol dehydrogenase system)
MIRALVAYAMTVIFVLVCTPGWGQSAPGTIAAIPILYLSKNYVDPARASLIDPVAANYGLQGAQFGIEEINKNGRFLGKQYELMRVSVPADGDIKAAARAAIAAGHLLIIADLTAADLLTVADLPEAREAVLLDARTSDDSLRQQDCRDNVFHLLPNWAMRADALSQYLAQKHWRRWLLVTGVAPEDQAYVAAIKRAASKVGAKIVAEKRYEYRTDDENEPGGHEQLQSQIPGLTHTAASYDVLMVADHRDAFGDYLLFNTWDSRLVAGTHGLVAEAWDHQFREYAARGVLYRFFLAASREMTERDYGNWLAASIFGEAITRGGHVDAAAVKAYLLSDGFSVAAFKGEGLTFRQWDHQLRQPVLLFGPHMLVSMAPLPNVHYPKFQTDALGFDQSESECHLAQ